jgi:hypothetical protein
MEPDFEFRVPLSEDTDVKLLELNGFVPNPFEIGTYFMVPTGIEYDPVPMLRLKSVQSIKLVKKMFSDEKEFRKMFDYQNNGPIVFPNITGIDLKQFSKISSNIINNEPTTTTTTPNKIETNGGWPQQQQYYYYYIPRYMYLQYYRPQQPQPQQPEPEPQTIVEEARKEEKKILEESQIEGLNPSLREKIKQSPQFNVFMDFLKKTVKESYLNPPTKKQYRKYVWKVIKIGTNIVFIVISGGTSVVNWIGLIAEIIFFLPLAIRIQVHQWTTAKGTTARWVLTRSLTRPIKIVVKLAKKILKTRLVTKLIGREKLLKTIDELEKVRLMSILIDTGEIWRIIPKIVLNISEEEKEQIKLKETERKRSLVRKFFRRRRRKRKKK